MNVSSISLSNVCSPRKNFFIRYANSFMSAVNAPEEPVDVAKTTNLDNKCNKSMGIETLTIFPKEIKNVKTIITC